jgi:MYXO-CTERM domain-containing protein
MNTRSRCSMALVASAAIMVTAGVTNADVITFGNTAIDHLNQAGPQIEGNFSYTATVGDGWELQTIYGNPPAALVTFFNVEGAFVGDMVEFEHVGGALFMFESIDFRTISSSGSDQVVLTGYRDGAFVDSLALDYSTTVFQTVPSGFSEYIDLLVMEVTFDGNNAGIYDNVVLTPIPAPGALALLGLAGLACRRRRTA